MWRRPEYAECHPHLKHRRIGLCVTCYEKLRKGYHERDTSGFEWRFSGPLPVIDRSDFGERKYVEPTKPEFQIRLVERR